MMNAVKLPTDACGRDSTSKVGEPRKKRQLKTEKKTENVDSARKKKDVDNPEKPGRKSDSGERPTDPMCPPGQAPAALGARAP